MKLRHIHLPSTTTLSPPSFPTYLSASQLQEHLRRDFLNSKDVSAPAAAPPPPPALLSFTPLPTYTLGRRQVAPLTVQELARLSAPLTVSLGGGPSTSPATYTPAIHPSPRGGLTTYHGPGQLVLWPLLDLKSGIYRAFTVRSYACLLEQTTISVLAKLYGLTCHTTGDPGVWIQDRKIAAMGVHLRRHVSSLGVAVNLDMPTTMEEGDETRNPWRRFVACGLEGKEVTCVRREVEVEMGRRVGGKEGKERLGRRLRPEVLASAWAEELAGRIGVEGVDFVDGKGLKAMGGEGLGGGTGS